VAQVIGKFKNGRYKELPKLVRHFVTDKIRIICEKPTPVNLDGELRMWQDVTMSVAKEKLRFFFPKGLQWQNESTALNGCK
jgi:diacylglycerol kinase family enzyme